MSSSSSYIVKLGRFGVGKFGNIHETTKHVAMQPHVKDGPGLSRLGCRHTQDAATPWLARLATAFARWAGG